MSRKFKIEPVNLEDYVDIRPVKKVKKNNYKNDAIKMISHKIKCGECQIIFESTFLYDKHMYEKHIETNHQKYTCKFCTVVFIFSKPESLEQHLKTCHHICEHCNIDLKSEKPLRRHIKTVHEVEKCQHCHIFFPSKMQLKDHFKSVHILYMCDLCMESFETSQDQENHECIFKCENCTELFKSESELVT